MKKLITVVLILALLLPAAACAVQGDSPYFGKWVGMEHHAIVHYSTQMHYLYLDGTSRTSFYLLLEFNHDDYSIEHMEPEKYKSHWEVVDDHLRVPASGISYIDLYYDAETDTLHSDNPKVTFVRLP